MASNPQNDPRKGGGGETVHEGRDEGNPETKKQKYPLHRPCRLFLLYYARSLFPSVLSLPFLSYCGNVLQVCCIPTCKSRGIIDFLTSSEDNQRIESQARCDGGAALPRASVPSHRLLLRGGMNKNGPTCVTLALECDK